MTKTIEIATKLIKLNEGLDLEVYHCDAGYPTFGFGTNLKVLDANIVEKIYNLQNNQDKQGLEALAVELLDSEIINCNRALSKQKWFNNDLSEFQQAIILDLAYNIGVSGVLKFKNMIKAISDHNYGTAFTEMLDSKYHYKMICYGYKDELKKSEIDNYIDITSVGQVLFWWCELKTDYKQLRSACNALSLQFNKPLGKYKELF